MKEHVSAKAVSHPTVKNVLVLQGGGALGSYQCGVYEGLHAAGIAPDWFVGTSIGAINAAIMAGNVPGQRVERQHRRFEQEPAPRRLAGGG